MINYNNLAKAQQFYSNRGFTYIETPWTVTKEVSGATKPLDRPDLEIVGKNKVLVASGEQSFLYMMCKGFLPPGRYQTITPCFREEAFDFTHTKYFMKCELIETQFVDEAALKIIVDEALCFFNIELGLQKATPIKTDVNTYDIQYYDEGTRMIIELGSYGIREYKPFKWIYGTGCAEPRTSLCQKIKV